MKAEGIGRFDPRKRVLIIKPGYSETLDPDGSNVVSLGDILRTTVVLHLFPPDAYHVTWVVDKKGVALLKDNPYIERLLVINAFTPHLLLSESFDLVINFEKEPGICAVADRIPAWRRYGFRLDPQTHEVVSYDLSDEALRIVREPDQKRRKRRSWSDLLYEMLGHRYEGQPYVLGLRPAVPVQHDVGLNHLIGSKFPLKRWPEARWKALEETLAPALKVCWQQGTGDIESYIAWIASCRMLVTNDSLGLHLALALGKPVVALFGPTIATEVDGPGLVRITPPSAKACMPCLSDTCARGEPCMAHIAVAEVADAVHAALGAPAPVATGPWAGAIPASLRVTA